MRELLREISHSKTKPKMAIPNVGGEDIKFDCFSMTKATYNSLVNRYGMDVVASSCVRLDDFIRENTYIPYRTPKNALESKFIKEELLSRKQRADELKTEKRIPIEDVDDKDKAIMFIEATPSHLRSLDEDCIRLKKEYDL